MNLFLILGDIADIFLEEAETTDIAAYLRKRKHKRGVTAFAAASAAAGLGIALTLWAVKNGKVGGSRVA